MTERRRQKRALCAELVTLEWMDERGRARTETAVLEDISRHGACLQIETSVPVGATAYVWYGNEWKARCETTYCSFQEIGYFVGLEFDGGMPWSPDDFRPSHFLDVFDLASPGRCLDEPRLQGSGF